MTLRLIASHGGNHPIAANSHLTSLQAFAGQCKGGAAIAGSVPLGHDGAVCPSAD
jgi:hypothetical protein